MRENQTRVREEKRQTLKEEECESTKAWKQCRGLGTGQESDPAKRTWTERGKGKVPINSVPAIAVIQEA